LISWHDPPFCQSQTGPTRPQAKRYRAPNIDQGESKLTILRELERVKRERAKSRKPSKKSHKDGRSVNRVDVGFRQPFAKDSDEKAAADVNRNRSNGKQACCSLYDTRKHISQHASDGTTRTDKQNS